MIHYLILVLVVIGYTNAVSQTVLPWSSADITALPWDTRWRGSLTPAVVSAMKVTYKISTGDSVFLRRIDQELSNSIRDSGSFAWDVDVRLICCLNRKAWNDRGVDSLLLGRGGRMRFNDTMYILNDQLLALFVDILPPDHQVALRSYLEYREIQRHKSADSLARERQELIKALLKKETEAVVPSLIERWKPFLSIPFPDGNDYRLLSWSTSIQFVEHDSLFFHTMKKNPGIYQKWLESLPQGTFTLAGTTGYVERVLKEKNLLLLQEMMLEIARQYKNNSLYGGMAQEVEHVVSAIVIELW